MFTLPNLQARVVALAAHVPGPSQLHLRVAFGDFAKNQDVSALLRAVKATSSPSRAMPASRSSSAGSTRPRRPAPTLSLLMPLKRVTLAAVNPATATAASDGSRRRGVC